MDINNTALDKIALSTSIFCAMHCLFLPVFLLFFPTINLGQFGDESFHSMLLYLIIPVSLIALLIGCKEHKRYFILFYGFIGISILFSTAIWGHDFFGETLEVIFTLIGTSIVSYGHIKNQKLCREKNCHH